MEIDVVEGGLHLVEQVEGRRPAAEDGEQERQGCERALPTGQERELAHVLAVRASLNLDAGVEGVVGIGEPEAAGAAGEQRLEQLGEVVGDVGEGGREQLDDLGVDGPDHLAELAA